MLDEALKKHDAVAPPDDLRVTRQVEDAIGHTRHHEVHILGPDLEHLGWIRQGIRREGREADKLKLWEVVPAPADRDLHDVCFPPELVPAVPVEHVAVAGEVAMVVVGRKARIVAEP